VGVKSAAAAAAKSGAAAAAKSGAAAGFKSPPKSGVKSPAKSAEAEAAAAGVKSPAKSAEAEAEAAGVKSPAKSGVKSPAKSGVKSPAGPGSGRRSPRLDPAIVARKWASKLERERPGLVAFVLDRLAEVEGRPAWQPRLDPTSELILTILTQNSADINAEVAFAALRTTYPSAPAPAGAADATPRHFPGWGGIGLPDMPPPDWAAVEAAPIPELTDVIRPGGLANQKAPRLQAALRALIANGGSYSLEFLAGKPPLEARDWLSAIPGIGKKTASVVLLFSFGTPLMPVDRHVHRVSARIGLIPPDADADAAHDYYLAMLTPEQMYETHVSLISHGRRTCHARNPDCEHCPLAMRCRYFTPGAV
jgi:endonuclease-3